MFTGHIRCFDKGILNLNALSGARILKEDIAFFWRETFLMQHQWHSGPEALYFWVVCLSHICTFISPAHWPFLWTIYLKNTMRFFLQTLHKCPIWLKIELIRLWRSLPLPLWTQYLKVALGCVAKFCTNLHLDLGWIYWILRVKGHYNLTYCEVVL